jgi:hypothetical protein
MNLRKIIREEIDDWDLFRGEPVELVLNKAFHFEETANPGDENYRKLTDLLVKLGFKPMYSTPIVLDSQAIGLYAYQDIGGDYRFVYTTEIDHDDEEDYYQHIKGFASDESIDGGKNLELVNVRDFIKYLN